MGFPSANLLRAAGRRAWLFCELALLTTLILTTRCANYADVFVGGQVYFVDADCYSRMSRVRMVAEHPGTVVRRHEFENYPAGTIPHTTAPLDYLIVGLASSLGGLTAQPLDLAGALISPLFALAGGWFLWWWARRMKFAYGWAAWLLFALSPILAHGTALGRPDHQSLLLLLLLSALAAEWTLQQAPSRGWGIVSGLSWGLACWVSLYEPAVFLAVLLLLAGAKMWRTDRRPGWLVFAGIFLIAGLVERRWPQLPAADLQAFYTRWSATIGELSRVSLTNPIWLEWFGGLILLAPVLLVVAVRRGELPRSFAALLLAAFALTLWQARWGYFLAMILCLTIPTLLATVKTKWLGLLLAVVAFAPFLSSWDREFWPNEEAQTRRAVTRQEAVEWRAAASNLRSDARDPFLAPWWLAPSAAYWSGQPAVAGSSHESLAGIVASARFFLSPAPNEALKILRAHGVRAVLAYDGERTAQNSAAILGAPVPSRALCFILDQTPAQAPPFLLLKGENRDRKSLSSGELATKFLPFPPGNVDIASSAS